MTAEASSTRARVQIVTTDFPPITGGIARWTVTTSQALALAGIKNWVVTSVRDDPSRNPAGIEVDRTHYFTDRMFLKAVPLALKTLRLTRRRRPDLNIAMTWKHEGVVAALTSRLFRMPYIVFVHGSEILRFRKRGLTRWLMRRVLNRCSVIVANSEFTANLVRDTGTDAPVKVVMPFIDVPEEQPKDHPAKRDISLLTVGRLVKRKGHARVIRNLPALLEIEPRIVYNVAGDGELRSSLERLITELGVQDHVHLLGEVSDEEVHDLLAGCDIYVSAAEEDPTDVEGFGIAFLEAAARGKPIVVGNTGGVKDAVIDGETGYLVDPNDDLDLRDALLRLAGDAELRRKLGANGRRRVESDFSLTAGAARLAAIVDGVLAASNSRRG